MPTASRLQLDFWQSGPDAQLVQRKLGCALVELRQLTLAGNLGMQATEASLLLASKITTVAVHPLGNVSRLHQSLRSKWLYFRAGNTPSATHVKMGMENAHL